jgi:hypothetical protein
MMIHDPDIIITTRINYIVVLPSIIEIGFEKVCDFGTGILHSFLFTCDRLFYFITD